MHHADKQQQQKTEGIIIILRNQNKPNTFNHIRPKATCYTPSAVCRSICVHRVCNNEYVFVCVSIHYLDEHKYSEGVLNG